MGLFKKIGRIAAGVGTLGASELLGIGKQIEGTQYDDINAYADQQAGLRSGAKQTQYGLLSQMQAPKTTPQMEARIKALEEESTRPMLQDANYGYQVGQATRGGAQALSAIQNRQAATGTEGGFRNVGSMNDVYDRLGGQLSQIAAQNQIEKERKRDVAAQARQQIADAQINYNNSIVAAKRAIESGDAQAAQAALAQAQSAKMNLDMVNQQTMAGLIGAGMSAAATMAGKPPSMGGGQQQIQSNDMLADPYTSIPMQGNYLSPPAQQVIDPASQPSYARRYV